MVKQTSFAKYWELQKLYPAPRHTGLLPVLTQSFCLINELADLCTGLGERVVSSYFMVLTSVSSHISWRFPLPHCAPAIIGSCWYQAFAVASVALWTNHSGPGSSSGQSFLCLRSLLKHYLNKKPFTTMLSTYKYAHPLFPITSLSWHDHLYLIICLVYNQRKKEWSFGPLSLTPVPNHQLVTSKLVSKINSVNIHSSPSLRFFLFIY